MGQVPSSVSILWSKRSVAIGLCCFILLASTFFAKIDHDESQYVAAVALTEYHLPFRDFLYLQTPLQPIILSFIAQLTDSYLFLSLRLLNAALAGATLLLVYRIVRDNGGDAFQAFVATILLASNGALIFAGALARNDALPMMLYTIGLYLLLVPVRNPNIALAPLRYLLAGLAIGAAASAKLNYGIPAMAVGIWAISQWRVMGPEKILALALGGLTGLLPTLAFLIIAPDATLFGVFEYSLRAPRQWRELNGQSWLLSWPMILIRLLRFLAEGPALIALIAIAGIRLQEKRDGADRSDAVLRLLDILIVAGLIAAILPQPTFRQYIVPVLPPLFIRLGLSLDGLTRRWRFWRPALAVGAVMGIVVSQRAAARNLISGESPPVEATRDAHWIGKVLRHERASGPLAGIRPERYVDSGWPVDRRFVTGPFIFRTVRLLSRQQEQAFSVVAQDNLDHAFAEAPPGAIVVGLETRSTHVAPNGLDYPMEIWAINNRYEQYEAPSGEIRLYVRPRAGAGPSVVSVFPARKERL